MVSESPATTPSSGPGTVIVPSWTVAELSLANPHMTTCRPSGIVLVVVPVRSQNSEPQAGLAVITQTAAISRPTALWIFEYFI